MKGARAPAMSRLLRLRGQERCPRHLDVALVAAAKDGDGERRADIAADGAPDVVWGHRRDGLAVEGDDLVVDEEPRLVRALARRHGPEVDVMVGLLPQRGADRARLGAGAGAEHARGADQPAKHEAFRAY